MSLKPILCMGTVIGQDRDTAAVEARFADVLDWVCSGAQRIWTVKT